MFDTFTRLVSDASGWAYAIVLLFALADAVIPVVPSEATVITAGVVASAGHLQIELVIVAAAIGAWCGDNLAYLLGHRFGSRITGWFFKSDKGKRRLDWAEEQLDRRGGELVAVGRFVPGGRTAVTLAAGLLGFPWRRFAFFDGLAACFWASYAALLGYAGGHAFEDHPANGLYLAFGLAVAVGGLIELVRWVLRRRKRREPVTEPAGSPSR